MCSKKEQNSELMNLYQSRWSDIKLSRIKKKARKNMNIKKRIKNMIKKETKLGAYELIPVKMERYIVKWDQKKGKKKLERWHKITKEAAEQSHRHYIPQIQEPKTIQQLVDDSEDYTYKLVAF